NTAPRSDVSGAFCPVLRYLTPHRPSCSPPTPKKLLASVEARATAPLQSCNALGLRNSACAPRSTRDSSGLQSPWVFHLASPEKLPARAPVSDRRDIVQSIAAARAQTPPDTRPSSASASASDDDCRCKSRCPLYPTRAISPAIAANR